MKKKNWTSWRQLWPTGYKSGLGTEWSAVWAPGRAEKKWNGLVKEQCFPLTQPSQLMFPWESHLTPNCSQVLPVCVCSLCVCMITKDGSDTENDFPSGINKRKKILNKITQIPCVIIWSYIKKIHLTWRLAENETTESVAENDVIIEQVLSAGGILNCIKVSNLSSCIWT